MEFVHPFKSSLVNQRDVGKHTATFARALRAALREDPDVIVIGEMRELDAIQTAVTAAETGHLVLATLHTNDVPQTVNRILDLFPAEQQGQVRHQLSLALSAIVCQQLVPKKDGTGRVVAVELLVASDPIRAQIRKGAFHQLHSELTLGRRLGMLTMEDSLATLVKSGVVAEADARLRTTHADELTSLLR